jgi:hypothetical protein
MIQPESAVVYRRDSCLLGAGAVVRLQTGLDGSKKKNKTLQNFPGRNNNTTELTTDSQARY